MILSYLYEYIKSSTQLNDDLQVFSFVVLLFSVMALLAFFNLLFFLIVNYYLSSEWMDKLESCLPNILFKLLSGYKMSSLVTIMVETCLAVVSLSYLMWLSVMILLYS